MLALYIISGIVLIVAALLLCPVSIGWKYDKKMSVTAKYLFFNIPLSSKKEQKEDKNAPQKNVFGDYYKKHGFSKTVSQVFGIIKTVAERLWWLIKKLKIKGFTLDITVATENAAHTAIEYGAVCSAVYPAVAFVGSVAQMDIKRMNVSADFEGAKSSLETSGVLKCRLIWAFVAAVGLIVALVKMRVININPNKVEGANNGRK